MLKDNYNDSERTAYFHEQPKARIVLNISIYANSISAQFLSDLVPHHISQVSSQPCVLLYCLLIGHFHISRRCPLQHVKSSSNLY